MLCLVRLLAPHCYCCCCCSHLLLQEFSAGHIKGALNLDSTAFTDKTLVDKLVEQLEAKSQVS
jgi:3-mercaptopyruvate sulfurtransferase SseA